MNNSIETQMNRLLVKHSLVNLTQEEIDNWNIPILIKNCSSNKNLQGNFRPR